MLYEQGLARHAMVPMPDPDPTALLDFQITAAGWRRIPRLRARLMQAAQMTAAHLPKKLHFPFTATVLLAGNSKIAQLNHDFRGTAHPTNVLSFPQFDRLKLLKSGKTIKRIEIGDIALANQYVVAEAKKEHKILINHITHLVIHGLLHLFGYDHIDEQEAGIMEKLEIRIMQTMGLPDPYAPLEKPTSTTKRRRK
jgi:probable rRNA maturation factor